MNSRIWGTLGLLLLAASLHAQRVDTIVSTNLSEPSGIATDNTGLYIADSKKNCILKYTSEGAILVLAGKSGLTGAGYADDIGTRAQFNDPKGMVYSAARNGLVIADYGNSAIRFLDLTTRNVTTLGGIGQQDGWADGGVGTSQFSFPASVDIDTNSGTIYVADFGNGLIRAIDSATNTTTYIDLAAASPTLLSGPSAVAVGSPGRLWVADSLNNVIWLVTSNAGGVTAKAIAGQFGNRGTNDADIGIQGRMSEPWSILWRGWLGDNADLMVSDSGNNILRRIFYNTNADVLDYSIATFTGSPGQAGSEDGLIPFATFNRPMGMAIEPLSGGFYIADAAASRIRLYSENTKAVTRVPDPRIGYVTFLIDPMTGAVSVIFNDLTGTGKTFNNFPLIVCMESDVNATVNYTSGSAPLVNVAVPTASSPTASVMPSGATVNDVPASFSRIPPDMFIRAQARKSDGSPPSYEVHAEFKFQCGSPLVVGINSADLQVSDITTNATLYYTLDGSEPTTNSAVVSNGKLSFAIEADVTLKVKAFNESEHFLPSNTTAVDLKLADYLANRLIWGYPSDEGSSKFIGAAGQTFFAPVGLTMIPGQAIYSFQFDAAIVRETTTPWTPTMGFHSDLKEKIANTYFDLDQSLYAQDLVATNLVLTTNEFGTNMVIVRDLSEVTGPILASNYVNTVAVGWNEVFPNNSLYDSLLQDLVSYSAPHDIVHAKDGRTVLGSFWFHIPTNVQPDSIYQIQLQNAAGTDKSARPILMQMMTNGSLAEGAINAMKQVKIADAPPKYLVGSILPFRWFNAGDFGSNTIVGGDVVQAFEAAVYHLRTPTASDMFNAMDSADATVVTNWANTPAAEFNSINSMVRGDGVIDLNDLYVTFRRSLDPALTWYNRYWTNGVLTNEPTPNLLAAPTNLLRKSTLTAARWVAASRSVVSGPHSLKITGSDMRATVGQTLAVPVNAEIIGDAPIRTFLMSVKVVALDGSPAITNPISFYETDNLVTSSRYTLSDAPNSYAVVTLDSTVDGVYGTNQMGTILVDLPAGVTTNSSYLVHFDRFSASPNGLALFPTVKQDSLVTLSDRSGSSWQDGIPDAWRLRYFGTVSNLLSAATADADGDGVSNMDEYAAGTNPVDPLSKPQIAQPPSRPILGLVGVSSDPIPSFTLQWPTESGRSYVVETSLDMLGTNWVAVSTNLIGTGTMTQFTDTNATGQTKFYRVKAQ